MWQRFDLAKENGDDILILSLETETALFVYIVFCSFSLAGNIELPQFQNF